jgi:hypothetical protein
MAKKRRRKYSRGSGEEVRREMHHNRTVTVCNRITRLKHHFSQNITCHRGQAECVVEFARNPAEEDPIPIHPLGSPRPPRSIQGKMLIAISESRGPRRNSVRYPVNAG